MSHFPDDILDGDFASEEQKQQRLIDLSNWLKMFAEDQLDLLGKQVVIDPVKVSLLNSTYWETVEGRIRPRMISTGHGNKRIIDRHKIASATELCVCFVEPIDNHDPEAKTEINARLAFYLGLNIIGNWSPDKISTLFVGESFNREHLAWLCAVNCHSDFPIFSNAATWHLVELLCLERTARLSHSERLGLDANNV